MVSFSDLKKSRENNFNKLIDKINQLSKNQNFGEEDSRLWTPTVDKEGNGFALIRFLPTPPVDGDSLPFVMIWDHGFQGPGGWYIEKSLTSIGQTDPVAEYNSMLWNRNQPGDRDIVSGIPARAGQPGKAGTKRRLLYYSNILVINDPAKPENNGKVFLFKYGKKIYDKIRKVMEPDKLDPDAREFDPFDFWEGANFRMKIKKADGYRSYEDSKFDSQSPLFNGDEAKMEEIWNQEYSLKEIVDPKNFKTYDELKAKLNRVLNVSVAESTSIREQPSQSSSQREISTDDNLDLPWNNSSNDDENDDELLEFRKLVE